MIKFLLHLLFLSLLCVGLSRCKHEPGPSSTACGEATTIDEIMQWAYFKTGTYWVYQEETTGELDTMSVVTHGDGIHDGSNYRWFSYEAVSSRDGYTYYWWFSESYSNNCPSIENCYCNKIYCSKSRPGDAVGEGRMLIFPIYIGNWISVGWGGGEGGLTSVQSTDSPVTILGSNVTINTVIFKIDNSVCDEWTEAYYHLAMNYGIVKKTLPELSESWLLKEISVVN